ncbi:MAG: hypothetical protein HC789_11610 [Microcoleus sp. CSU_2_2]|nr:hypothetical protein [Microcoleus sp. SU_5_3]NJS10961.1 hypothetical protein [Microcoleus sp. CSU_2_2]
MFPYTDPTGTNFLESQGALNEYRAIIDRFYRDSAGISNSGFTLLDAFESLPPGTSQIDSIPWSAFPITASASFQEIDKDRFQWQDEYIEWQVERSATGEITQIIFTTEFPEYYQALAMVSADALIAGIQNVIPDANPTLDELFGSGFDPGTTSGEDRAQRFRQNLIRNPWNNGEKGILCLTQQFNTAGALFNLLDKCAIKNTSIPSSAVCGAVGGACGPNRNSDPRICQASQNTVRSSRAISLVEPVGIKIKRLFGSWEIDGVAVDINDKTNNQGAWVISRNGRRAVLDITKKVTLGGSVITSGAEVSNNLQVEADVISAPESSLANWAKTGQEFMRAPLP